jgi:hypothetical protein
MKKGFQPRTGYPRLLLPDSWIFSVSVATCSDQATSPAQRRAPVSLYIILKRVLSYHTNSSPRGPTECVKTGELVELQVRTAVEPPRPRRITETA